MLQTSTIRPSSSVDALATSAYRIVDWSRHSGPAPDSDVDRLLKSVARDGAAKLAILVSTPRTLMAATVVAEQAELLGAQVRVFIGATEAMAWLYRDLADDTHTQEWPVQSDMLAANLIG
jgi:hypothetical protein